MLELKSREAKIGAAINTRTEKHGEDDVAALDIPLEFLLEPDELNALLKSETAADRLFRVGGDPALPALKTLSLKEKIEGARVTLTFDSLNEEITLDFSDAKLAKIHVEPKFSSKSMCYLTVQVVPDLDDQAILHLLGHMNGTCEIELHVKGYGGQKELPLEQPAEEAA
jgi:hypothetical protein